MMWARMAMGHHRRLGTSSPPPRLHASRGRRQPESGIVAIVVELRQQCTTPLHSTNPSDLIHPLQNHRTTIVSSQSRTYSQTTIHRRNLPYPYSQTIVHQRNKKNYHYYSSSPHHGETSHLSWNDQSHTCRGTTRATPVVTTRETSPGAVHVHSRCGVYPPCLFFSVISYPTRMY